MSHFPVLSKQIIAQNIKRMDISAPDIAKSARPGQFVLLMADEGSLRLPFPIVETNPQKGSIAIVFKEESLSAQKLGSLSIGQSLYVVMGPLGNPDLPKEIGTSVCIGYELGIAHIVPISRYLQKQGNKNFGILGTATKRNLVMESQMRLSCQSIFVMSEDGSAGKKGLVTDALRETLARYPVDQIFMAAPSKVIQEVLPIAQEKNIKLKALLTPLALSGIGFCGTDEIKMKKGYASFSADGPIFDAGLIDFNIYDARVARTYGE
jgi:ferredoxin--NADP+ reductase